MPNDLTPRKPDDVSGLLGRTVDNVIQGLSGLAASDRKEVALSVGHIIQRARAGKFVQAVKDEWDALVAKGRIKGEVIGSEQHLDCLQELLDFIDRDLPDAQRFTAMKNLYLHIAADEGSTKPDYLPQQLMKVCRTLSSGEIIVLLTVYRLAPSKRSTTERGLGAEGWLRAIVDESGLYRELVETHEDRLMDKRLLTPRRYGDRSGVTLGDHFRLTDLAVALCQWISAPPG